MTEDELREVMDAHRRAVWTMDRDGLPVDSEGECQTCGEGWPCETYRLAKLALAGMQVVTAARSGHERLFEFDICLCELINPEQMCDLAAALAEYEEATK